MKKQQINMRSAESSASPPRLQRIFRMSDLPNYVGLHKTVIRELIEAGEFPKSIPLSDSGRGVGWLEDDLIAKQVARIARREKEQS